MIVYKTINLINGKIYVGQDTKNNPKYLGSGKLLRNAFIKYGKENFKKEIIEECFDKNLLDEREKYWIEALNARDLKIGYNIAIGGEGQNLNIGKDYISKIHKGKKVSQETIDKIKKTKATRPFPQASIDNLLKYAGHRKGAKMSDESKQLISMKNKGKSAWNKGKSLSNETKEKIGRAAVGRVLSAETRQKMSNAAKKRKYNKLNKNDGPTTNIISYGI